LEKQSEIKHKNNYRNKSAKGTGIETVIVDYKATKMKGKPQQKFRRITTSKF